MCSPREASALSRSGDSGRCSKLSRRSTSLFIVIISILAYEAVSSHSASESRTLTSTQIDRLKENETNNAVATSGKKSNKQQERNQQAESGSNKVKLSCEYDKGQWNFCQADGSQTKVLRLKSGDRDCKANKTIRRDCETVGCKYARGQWSSACINGQRFRVDTLVERIGAPGTKAGCKPSRRVTKDCRRTCHYVKSAWSECANGTRTRLLTLASEEGELNQAGVPAAAAGSESLFTSVANNSDAELTRLPSSPGDSTSMSSGGAVPKTTEVHQTAPVGDHQRQQCPARKLIKRACRRAAGASTTIAARVSPQTPSTATSTATGASNGARRSYQPSSSTTTGPTPATNNMTPAQKRRLKLMQARQQQQQSGSTKSTPTVASRPTTTNQPDVATSANRSGARDRGR